MQIKATEVKKGQTVMSVLSAEIGHGKYFKVGKIDKDNIGRVLLFNTKGKLMHASGKNVKYYVQSK